MLYIVFFYIERNVLVFTQKYDIYVFFGHRLQRERNLGSVQVFKQLALKNQTKFSSYVLFFLHISAKSFRAISTRCIPYF